LTKAIATINEQKLKRTMSARPNLFCSSSVSVLLAASPKNAAAVFDLISIERAPDAAAASTVDTESNVKEQDATETPKTRRCSYCG
jgi:hypothetical protein